MKKLGQKEYPRRFPIRVVSHGCAEMRGKADLIGREMIAHGNCGERGR